MAPGARALRKTASISRVGRSARGKAVSHGVFSGSWVREEQRRGCCGTGGRLLSCSHPTGHIPKVTGMGYRRLGWLGQGRLSLGCTQTLQSPHWDPPDLSGCGRARCKTFFHLCHFASSFKHFLRTHAVPQFPHLPAGSTTQQLHRRGQREDQDIRHKQHSGGRSTLCLAGRLQSIF